MDIGRLFTENWPYKVAAIVLTVLLWLSVSSEGDRSEQSVPTRLDLQVADSAWSLREVRPPEIMTTFRGGRGDVFASLFEQPTIRKRIDVVDDSIIQLSLSPAEVIYNRSLGVEPVGVDPSTVTIYLEERLGKWVTVTGWTDARAEGETMLVGMEVSPDSVWLQGPASFVNTITELTTELLSVGTVSERISRQLTVVLPPDLIGLEVEPPTVLASVEVDSVRTRRFQRAVTPMGPGAASVVLDPPTVTVSVTGAAATIDGLQAGDISLAVELSGPVDAESSLPIRVDLPPGVSAIVDLSPERIRVSQSSPAPSEDPSGP